MARDPNDELDEVLDALWAGDGASVDRLVQGGSDPELARMATAARLVGQAVAEGVAPPVRARHVRLLMEEAARLAGPQVVAKPRPLRRWRRLAASLGAVVAVLLVGAPATAALAANAQPGDALYGTKLAVENIRLVLQRDPGSKVALRLEFAEKRVAEVSKLLAAGRTARAAAILAKLSSQQAAIETALARLQAGATTRPALVQRIRALVERHLAHLSALADRSGCDRDPARSPQCPALLRARARSEQILRRLGRLQAPRGGVGTEPAPAHA